MDTAHIDFLSDGILMSTVQVGNAHFKDDEMLIGWNPEHGTREVTINYQASGHVTFGSRGVRAEDLRRGVARVYEIAGVFETVLAPSV